jgi:hypothetical protein
LNLNLHPLFYNPKTFKGLGQHASDFFTAFQLKRSNIGRLITIVTSLSKVSQHPPVCQEHFLDHSTFMLFYSPDWVGQLATEYHLIPHLAYTLPFGVNLN